MLLIYRFSFSEAEKHPDNPVKVFWGKTGASGGCFQLWSGCVNAYLVHGEVREEDDEVLLHSHDEASVAFVSPGNHLYVVAHPEIFSQLVSRELQRVLHRETNTGSAGRNWRGTGGMCARTAGVRSLQPFVP